MGRTLCHETRRHPTDVAHVLSSAGNSCYAFCGVGKDLFGCNIKAQTSFKACNILDLELPFRVAVTAQGAATFKTNLLNALAAAGVNAPLVAALNATLNFGKLAQPGSPHKPRLRVGLPFRTLR
jgi:hypothetical protein